MATSTVPGEYITVNGISCTTSAQGAGDAATADPRLARVLVRVAPEHRTARPSTSTSSCPTCAATPTPTSRILRRRSATQTPPSPRTSGRSATATRLRPGAHRLARFRRRLGAALRAHVPGAAREADAVRPAVSGIGARWFELRTSSTPGTSSSTSSRGPKTSSDRAGRRRRSTCATSSRRGARTNRSGRTTRSPHTSRPTRSRVRCGADSTAIARLCVAALRRRAIHHQHADDGPLGHRRFHLAVCAPGGNVRSRAGPSAVSDGRLTATPAPPSAVSPARPRSHRRVFACARRCPRRTLRVSCSLCPWPPRWHRRVRRRPHPRPGRDRPVADNRAG